MRFERFFDKKSRAVMLLVGAAATLCIVWLVANVASGEKRIDHRIEHLYGVEDPRFLRTMGVLLGPRRGRQPLHQRVVRLAAGLAGKSQSSSAVTGRDHNIEPGAGAVHHAASILVSRRLR